MESSLSDGRKTIRDLGEYLGGLIQSDEARRVIVSIDAVKQWYLGQAHLSAGDKKMTQRAMLEVFEGAGLKILKGNNRIYIPAKNGRRKVTAIANFSPAVGEEWTALARDHLWDSEMITEAYQPM